MPKTFSTKSSTLYNNTINFLNSNIHIHDIMNGDDDEEPPSRRRLTRKQRYDKRTEQTKNTKMGEA